MARCHAYRTFDKWKTDKTPVTHDIPNAKLTLSPNVEERTIDIRVTMTDYPLIITIDMNETFNLIDDLRDKVKHMIDAVKSDRDDFFR